MTHTKYDVYTNDELIRFVEQGNCDPELTVELAKRFVDTDEELSVLQENTDEDGTMAERLREELEEAENTIADLEEQLAALKGA